MKLAKYTKPILDDFIIKNDWEIVLDRKPLEKDVSYQRRIEKLENDLRYNNIVLKRQNSTICNYCSLRKPKKYIQKIRKLDEWKSKNICNECFEKGMNK